MALNVQGESSSSSISSWKYHVFLSFRAEDTRSNFTDHLYASLQRRGITVFRDLEEIPRGLVIPQQLLTAIKDCLFSIVVLSQNYASSSWCLDELKKILEARKELGRQVIPIFYGVDPSDVRNQRGSIGEALAKHEERFNDNEGQLLVQQWRDALTQVATLSGWHPRGRKEADLVEDIVESIWGRLLPSYHDSLLVGIDERMVQMNSLLKIGLDDDVRFVGIWGMGGIGKTTLAKFVYNTSSSQFEISCFLANVGEVSKKGVAYLQRKLISILDMSSSMEIQDTEEGKAILQKQFRNKKVLLVLDDVNDISQLESLAAAPGWFGEGSRVIIATRDIHILRSHGVHGIYTVDFLSKHESLQLLSSKAFRTENPPEDYVELCESVVKYAGGLPLALQVLGSFLFGRSISEWKHALENTIQFASQDILETLQISYVELQETDKAIFLDIACFFKGWEKHRVIQVVKKFGVHPTFEIGLSVLVEKSLVIEVGNCLEMHDLFQEMGWRIVQEQFPKGVWQLKVGIAAWSTEDIVQLLEKYMGSDQGLGKRAICEFEILEEQEWLQVVNSSGICSKIWRIVGFVSSVVGVATYGGSLSFKRIFGEWTSLKMYDISSKDVPSCE